MRNGMHPRKRCRGVAMVEFAIVAPVLITMMLGIGEFGRAFYHYNTLTKSVREGTRHLAGNLPGTLDLVVMTDKLQTQARNLVVYGNPDGSGDPLLEGLSTADVSFEVVDTVNIRASATYEYAPAAVQALPGFYSGQDMPLSFTLNASTTMRKL